MRVVCPEPCDGHGLLHRLNDLSVLRDRELKEERGAVLQGLDVEAGQGAGAGDDGEGLGHRGE